MGGDFRPIDEVLEQAQEAWEKRWAPETSPYPVTVANPFASGTLDCPMEDCDAAEPTRSELTRHFVLAHPGSTAADLDRLLDALGRGRPARKRTDTLLSAIHTELDWLAARRDEEAFDVAWEAAGGR